MKRLAKKWRVNPPKILKWGASLLKGVLKIPHSRLNGDGRARLPGNVNMCFEGTEGESLLLHLDERGICASSGSACTTASLEPSHVLLALGLPHEIAHGSLRLSLSENNTEEEIEYLLSEIPKAVEKVRAVSSLWDDLKSGKRKHLID